VSEWHREPDHAGFVVTDDPGRVDLDVVHGYLSGESYWAAERTRAAQATANAASWCFSLVEEGSGAQVGFARLVTDYATFGWLADVFVLPGWRGRGLGHFLVGSVAAAAADVHRLTLSTRDAHGVYADVGFTRLSYPDRMMERLLTPLSPDLPRSSN
jgi:GNAT superfamily N-acetyltransferase